MEDIQVHKVKHRGYLVVGNKEVGKVELPCAVLENEQRIVSQIGIYAAFKRPLRSEKGNTGVPYIMEAQNLRPFYTDELLELAKPVYYYHYNGKDSLGYAASFLPQLCKLYVRANKEGNLTKSQRRFLAQAKLILSHLPNKPIEQMVDEESGYVYSKEKAWFKSNLMPYINKAFLKWQDGFPREFYQEIFRLHNWKYDPYQLKKPEFIILSKFLNDYLYFHLPEDIKQDLREEPPSRGKVKRPKKPSHSVSDDLENAYLNRFLIRLVTVMELSNSLENFRANFDRVFRKVYQMKLF